MNKEDVIKYIKTFSQGQNALGVKELEIQKAFQSLMLEGRIKAEEISIMLNDLEAEGRIYCLNGFWLITKKVKKEDEGDSDEKELIMAPTVLTDTFLCEEVLTEEGEIKYLCFTFKSGKTEFKDKVHHNGNVYIPVVDGAVSSGAVLLPSENESFQDISVLVEEIRRYIHKYLDVSEQYEQFAAYYILLSWVYDRFNTIPYIRALGDTGTGKGRYRDTICKLLYRPIVVSGAVTPAPIYRIINRWRGSLIIDEGDMKDSDAYNDVVTILNCGFERGLPVMRCDPDDPDNVIFFDPFGPKGIMSRYSFKDKALESRCLTEQMRQTTRKDIPPILPASFYLEQKKLRNKLLDFRFRYFKTIDTEMLQTIDLGDVEPRLKQGMSAFAVLFGNIPTLFEQFKAYLGTYQETLIEERANSFEGMIVNAIFDLVRIDYLSKDDISSAEIADKLNGGKKEKDSIKPAVVGKYLRSLGINTTGKKVNGAYRRTLGKVPEELFDLLFKRYISPEKYAIVMQGGLVSGESGESGHIGAPPSPDTGLLKFQDSNRNKFLEGHTDIADSPDTADTKVGECGFCMQQSVIVGQKKTSDPFKDGAWVLTDICQRCSDQLTSRTGY